MREKQIVFRCDICIEIFEPSDMLCVYETKKEDWTLMCPECSPHGALIELSLMSFKWKYAFMGDELPSAFNDLHEFFTSREPNEAAQEFYRVIYPKLLHKITFTGPVDV